MSFKAVTVLFVISTFIGFGSALKCYACSGTSTSDCAKAVNSSIAIQQCGKSTNFFSFSESNEDFSNNIDHSDKNYGKIKAYCLQISVSDFQPSLFARGCGLFPSCLDPCKFLQKHGHVKSCKACTIDLCNLQTSEDYEPSINVV